MTTSLELYRSLPRYVAARAVGGRLPGMAETLAPLRLVNRSGSRPLPGPGWVRVRPRLAGICGSDLATLSGASSLYFSPVVSLPFVPGHEVVGDTLDDAPGLPAGTRVVLEPVLGCEARGLEPCEACAAGRLNRCARVTLGHVSPGLQTGFCSDTGGGWSDELVAHVSQLHAVPPDLPDENAVLTEPIACALQIARQAAPEPGASVLVVGAGAVGLFTLLALRATTDAGSVLVVAKHPRQVALARSLGATEVVGPREATAAVRRSRRALRLAPERGAPWLLGGVDVAIDAGGSASSLDLALRTTRAGGRVVLAAMPAGGVDLTPAWFRELDVRGAYATSGGDFELALELAARIPVQELAPASYPLARWRDALDHATGAGRLGTGKVMFDLRSTQ
jgi:threonine dehydrogenase-like Zn-dependent dehydrogenase